MSATLTTTKPNERVEGYFDAVSAIFAAHDHPVILVEDGAMKWMGLRLWAGNNLDLLVRDNQINSIMSALLATGFFERTSQDMEERLNEKTFNDVPRLRDLRSDPLFFGFFNLWTESTYMLRVDNMDLVPIVDVHAWNTTLVEERFATTIETEAVAFTQSQSRGVQVLPQIRSSKTNAAYFVPSIPGLLDAFLNQERFQKAHQENTRPLGYRLNYHVNNFIRYLFLERASQRKVLLPLISEQSQAEMERRINAFKRKPLYVVINNQVVKR